VAFTPEVLQRILAALLHHRTIRTALVICSITLAAGLASAAPASASSGLGMSVQTEKAYIAIEDPHVHWTKPVTTGSLTDYDGTGDGGRAKYDLLAIGHTLYEVEGTIRASTEAQGEKLGEIQDALAVPFAGKAELNWYVSQVQLVQAGAFPKVTKVFGKVRVGLGFSEAGATLILSVTVAPTNMA
jgi:hypothetical protein